LDPYVLDDFDEIGLNFICAKSRVTEFKHRISGGEKNYIVWRGPIEKSDVFIA